MQTSSSTSSAVTPAKLEKFQTKNKIRIITAASLFDGHDAAINVMRRILQSMGAEVIHLGHNRNVEEVVTAALQEDAQAIAVSSYQGGHVEYFAYMLDLLRARNGSHIKVFGGGGGVIIPSEIAELAKLGVRIFSPDDGRTLGLNGMIQEILQTCDAVYELHPPTSLQAIQGHSQEAWCALARLLSCIEAKALAPSLNSALRTAASANKAPIVGITGTGGAGKSSLVDEWIRRLRLDQNDSLRIALLSIDPSRRKSGGALLGDRIRMNAIGPWPSNNTDSNDAANNKANDNPMRVFMRSMATRDCGTEIAQALPDAILACKAAGFDLILVETSGIGQGDAAIAPLADLSLYVMTPEYGASSQLEKIDMLDFADFIALNKFDRKGAQDALRDVAKQVQRNREAFTSAPEEMPVFGTIASRFNDDGVSALYFAMKARLQALGLALATAQLPMVTGRHSTLQQAIIPSAQSRYLAEVAQTIRGYKTQALQQAQIAREAQQLQAAATMLKQASASASTDDLLQLAQARTQKLHPNSQQLLAGWPKLQASYAGDEYVVTNRGKSTAIPLTQTTLSGTSIRRVALPSYHDHGDILHWLMLENVPGHFPYTAGVFPFKRADEDPTRMFAGEGDAFRTNNRFKLVSAGIPAKRLSTAFDSVTLYGNDPDLRPDIYGKIGNSGVSIATLDDMKALYDGFDLCSPSTSVSMTINGPAPTILAMFLNAALDQQLAQFSNKHGRDPNPDEAKALQAWVFENVRGTVQADILKEDQGQNTCLFSTEFSLKVMGDIAEYFVANKVRNFYSVSISGYHIAEAGANPISQLAFTLANGLTYVEAYLARGMSIDDFAPNLSFFFSNGMDPEYTVLGRVARRIWALAMRERYGANERSQKLKYHIQTSGRSLHAQEIQFNDIRTTLQALIAVYDNCNSLHTNAFDEAITTPTEDSVRRAMAIQLIINREWGLAKNENPNQGAFIIEELTELVEEAVLSEFCAISERGGVLGAMETGYQRGKIQDESMHYEMLKHSAELPIIGVNTFLSKETSQTPQNIALARSTEAEKQSQIQRLADFQQRHREQAPAMLKRLQQAVMQGDNVFAVLMDAVRVCSLGQITNALFEVGGQYRRNM